MAQNKTKATHERTGDIVSFSRGMDCAGKTQANA
jgi:hypothetical protein